MVGRRIASASRAILQQHVLARGDSAARGFAVGQSPAFSIGPVAERERTLIAAESTLYNRERDMLLRRHTRTKPQSFALKLAPLLLTLSSCGILGESSSGVDADPAAVVAPRAEAGTLSGLDWNFPRSTRAKGSAFDSM